MPHFILESAYVETGGSATIGAGDQAHEMKWDFEYDDGIAGLKIVGMAPGQEITKTMAASGFGYAEWERNKATIMSLLGDFFEPASNKQKLRRKGSGRFYGSVRVFGLGVGAEPTPPSALTLAVDVDSQPRPCGTEEVMKGMGQ